MSVDNAVVGMLEASKTSDMNRLHRELVRGLGEILSEDRVELHMVTPCGGVSRRRWPAESDAPLGLTREQLESLQVEGAEPLAHGGRFYFPIRGGGCLLAVAGVVKASLMEEERERTRAFLDHAGELLWLLTWYRYDEWFRSVRATTPSPKASDEFLTAWLKTASERANSELSYIALLTPGEERRLKVVAAHGQGSTGFLSDLPMKYPPIERALRTHLPVAEDNLGSTRHVERMKAPRAELHQKYDQERVTEFLRFLKRFESYLLLPLSHRRQLVGILAMHSSERNRFEPESVWEGILLSEYLAPLVEQTSVAENEEGTSDRELAQMDLYEQCDQLARDAVHLLQSDRAAVAIKGCDVSKGLKVASMYPAHRWRPESEVPFLPFDKKAATLEAFESSKPCLVEDVRLKDAKYAPEVDPSVGCDPTISALAVPLRVEGRRLGALIVDSYRPRAFDERTVDRLQALADRYAPLLATQNTDETFEKLEELLDAEGPRNWHGILDLVAHLVDATAGSIFLEQHNDVGSYPLVASLETPELVGNAAARYQRGERLPGRNKPTKTAYVLEHNTCTIKADLTDRCADQILSEGKVADLRDSVEDRDSPLLIVPISVDREVFGAIRLRRKPGRPFRSLDQHLVLAATQLIAGRCKQDRDSHRDHAIAQLLGKMITATEPEEIARAATTAFKEVVVGECDVVIRMLEEEYEGVKEPHLVLEYVSSDHLRRLAPPALNQKEYGAGYVWRKMKPLYVPDMGDANDPNVEWLYPDWRLEGGTSFQIPLIFEGKVRGTLTIRKKTKNAFSEPLRVWLEKMASVIFIAFVDSNERREVECRNNLLVALAEYGYSLDPTGDVAEQQRRLCSRLLSHMKELLGPKRCWVAIKNPSTRNLDVVTSEGEPRTEYLDQRTGRLAELPPFELDEVERLLREAETEFPSLDDLNNSKAGKRFHRLLRHLSEHEGVELSPKKTLLLPFWSQQTQLEAVFLFVLEPEKPLRMRPRKILTETMRKASELFSRFDEMIYDRRMAPVRLALQLVGNAAIQVEHHIRKPTSRLRAKMGEVKRSLEAPSEENLVRARGLLASMERNIELMDNQLDDLINCARVSHLAHREVNLEEILEEIKLTFVANPAVTVEEPSPRPGGSFPVEGQKELLVKALSELVKNALDALPDGNPNNRVHIQLETLEDMYRFHVRDNGKGLTEEEMEKAFLPFFTHSGNGKGLGLSSTASIVEIHRGKLTWCSDPGNTVFTVTLPRRRQA